MPYTRHGPHSDAQLQIAALEADLAIISADGSIEDRLRLHSALARAYRSAGRFGQALDHGHQELTLRHRIQGPDHPELLPLAVTSQAGSVGTGMPSRGCASIGSCFLSKSESSVLNTLTRSPLGPTLRGGLASWGTGGRPCECTVACCLTRSKC